MIADRRLTLALTVALAGSIACARRPGECSGKVSGAASGSFTCNVALRNSGDALRVLITPVKLPAGVKALSLPEMEIPLPVIPAKDYSLSALARARTLVTAPGHKTFVAEKSKQGQRGRLALKFTKLEVGKAHAVAAASGTLEAHLVPEDGGEGEVVLDLSF